MTNGYVLFVESKSNAFGGEVAEVTAFASAMKKRTTTMKSIEIGFKETAIDSGDLMTGRLPLRRTADIGVGTVLKLLSRLSAGVCAIFLLRANEEL